MYETYTDNNVYMGVSFFTLLLSNLIFSVKDVSHTIYENLLS